MWTPEIIKVSVILAILSLADAVVVKKENSLVAPYVAGADNLVFWDLIGSAQLGGTHVRLTTDESGKEGGIWNNFPMLANSWEFQTNFRIQGKGQNLYGDGMALWYARDILLTGPLFGSKEYFSGLGIFIDTAQYLGKPHKHLHPYISAVVNNGSLHYEHGEDGTMAQIGGCHVPIRNLDVPTKIAISYIKNTVSVYLDFEGLSQWKVCFKAQGVHLPTGYYFGITASTSEFSDNHDVISVTSLNMDAADHKWEDRKHVIPKAENMQIPPKYRKDAIKKEQEKLEKMEKQILKEKVEQLRVLKEEEMAEEEEEEDEWDSEEAAEEAVEEIKTAEPAEEESSPPSPSLIRKLIYITGAAVIILVAISVYSKYSERRRERMRKRLF